MKPKRVFAMGLAVMVGGVVLGAAQQAAPSPAPSAEAYSQLLEQLRAEDARLKELEAAVARLKSAQPAAPEVVAPPANAGTAAAPEPSPEGSPASAAQDQASPAAMAAAASMGDMDQHMSLPSGPLMKVRGFFDFNFGAGTVANPLVFPIVDNGCGTCGNPATPPHTTFQAGELDLFITSKLSRHLNFVGEVVFGPDTTNEFGVDIERYQLTYRANPYFSASGGRFHTSIGYYNTAYHHGNWFSTAEGRPIMYLFEDSGGILPVHMVGISFSGAVPNTEKLGLHWIAEVGNGLSSNPDATESVQNFYSDRNYKATNLAAYIRPERFSGLQIGGSWYHDGLNPAQAQNPLPLPLVLQNIESAHVVYFSSNWEFLSEGVLLSNHVTGMSSSYRSPMTYIQVARKFGIYKPYFRYQYVRDNPNDPINLLKGTYYGPSVGMRVDFSNFAAFKLQFNHLYESNQLAGNGLNAQVAFTF